MRTEMILCFESEKMVRQIPSPVSMTRPMGEQ